MGGDVQSIGMVFGVGIRFLLCPRRGTTYGAGEQHGASDK
jgi:hypothetical protein